MTALASRLILGLLALFWLLGAAPAAAQGPVVLDTLQIELWPEFDRPAVLVILAGNLPAAGSFPVELTVRIPASSGGPHAVAVQGEGGGLLNAPYTTTSIGDDLVVTMTLDRPNFHLEYYDPSLVIDGQERTYRFQWTAPAPVGSAAARVQEPVGATDLSAEPALTLAGAGDFGLNYYTTALGSLAAGQTVSVRLTYSKSTPALSAESVGASVVVTPELPEPAASPESSTLPIAAVAAGAGILAIGAGGIWLLRSRRQAAWENERRQRGRRRGRRRAGPSAAAVQPETDPPPARATAGYCPQCGRAHPAGDEFCRNCGAKLRA